MSKSSGNDCDAAAPAFLDRLTRRRAFLLALIAMDVLMSLLAASATLLFRFGAARAPLVLAATGGRTDYAVLACAIALSFPLAFAFAGLYDIESLFWGSGEYYRVVHAVTLSLGVFIIASYLLHLDDFSRLWLASTWVLSSTFLMVGRSIFRASLHAARRRSKLMRPTLILGDNHDAQRMALSLRLERTSGLALIGCLTPGERETRSGEEFVPGVPFAGRVSELPDVIDRLGADAVVIISSAFAQSEVSGIVSTLRRLPIDVHISSGLFDVLPARILVRDVGGTPFMLVRSTSLATHKVFMKRAFDLALSTMVLVFGLPIWLLIAAAIKLESPGPVFHRQERVGRASRRFRMYKFRSMCVDAEERLDALLEQNESDGPIFKMRNDPRATRVGRFLRRHSLDEFPQFLNVLLGDMSVVGPRPPLPTEVESYSDRQSKRLDVLPGITGLWQVSGRSDLTFDEMVRLDLFYIENWSLRYDLALVLRTIPSVIFSDGAY